MLVFIDNLKKIFDVEKIMDLTVERILALPDLAIENIGLGLLAKSKDKDGNVILRIIHQEGLTSPTDWTGLTPGNLSACYKIKVSIARIVEPPPSEGMVSRFRDRCKCAKWMNMYCDHPNCPNSRQPKIPFPKTELEGLGAALNLEFPGQFQLERLSIGDLTKSDLKPEFVEELEHEQEVQENFLLGMEAWLKMGIEKGFLPSETKSADINMDDLRSEHPFQPPNSWYTWTFNQSITMWVLPQTPLSLLVSKHQ